MKILCTLGMALTVIFNSIDLSEQFDCLPNGEPLPGFFHFGAPYSSSPSYADRPLSPSRTHFPSEADTPVGAHTPVRAYHKAHSGSPTNISLRVRPRSSVYKGRAPRIFGFELEQMRFIRLVPHMNPNRKFQIRRYTFPDDKPIQLRGSRNVAAPMPTEERHVLTTSDGDIMAIFERNNTQLRALYVKSSRLERAKINIHSGAVEGLTKAEIAETPTGGENPVSKTFSVVHENNI